ncbi:hypothetical protein HK102_000372 [Quaeritorhiza haematococci]|nr:hypothetical protein HK102_000372 [Quaeritorhiza haematococci]
MKCYWSEFSSTGVATLICVVPQRVGTDPDIKGTCIFALHPTRGFGMTLDRLLVNTASVLPSTPPAPTSKSGFNGTQYLIGFTSWNVTAYDQWTLAVMAPREQVYGPIDDANRRATIVVIVVTVAVLILSGGAMLVIMRPLAAVAAAMKRLTNFDFAVLEGGNLLNVNSLVAETPSPRWSAPSREEYEQTKSSSLVAALQKRTKVKVNRRLRLRGIA